MKRVVITATTVVLFLLLAGGVFAADAQEVIQINGISPFEDAYPGGFIDTVVRIENIGHERLNDVSVTLMVPELGMWGRTVEFDISTNDIYAKLAAMPIPVDAQAGWYDVRIVISNDDYKRVVYRPVYVQ